MQVKWFPTYSPELKQNLDYKYKLWCNFFKKIDILLNLELIISK